MERVSEAVKTFKDIHQEIFNEIYKSPEGWPEDLTRFDLFERAAKEYSKQWIVIAVALAGIDRTVEKNEETIRLIEYKIDSQ